MSWRSLTDDQIMELMTFNNEFEKEKDKRYWENWQKILKGVMGR